MKRRALISFLIGAAFFASLASPTLAQAPHSDGASVVAEAKAVAAQLQAHLDSVLKAGGRPDFSKPPASELVARAFSVKPLETLPSVRGDDLPWLVEWIGIGNAANKSILLFGVPQPVNAQSDPKAINRNFADYEAELAAAANFLVRVSARRIQAAFAFMDELPPAQRTPVRVEAFNGLRHSDAEALGSYLGWLAAGSKPAITRQVSAAFRDTGAVWATAFLPADLPGMLAVLDKAQAAVADEETRSNLSAFGALLAKAK